MPAPTNQRLASTANKLRPPPTEGVSTISHERSEIPIGWTRAAVSGLLIVAVAVGVLVYVPNLVLTQLTGLSRGGRVAIATVWFFLALGLLGWALRRLQAHEEI